MELEEWHQDLLAVERRGIGREIHATQAVPLMDGPATMLPRPHDEAVRNP